MPADRDQRSRPDSPRARRPRWLLALTPLLLVSCSRPPLLVRATVEVERSRIRAEESPIAARGRDPRRLAFEITVQDRTGADLALERIDASVFDPDGMLHGTVTIEENGRVAADMSAMYGAVMRGDWPAAAVVVFSTRVRTAEEVTHTAIHCRPLCDGCKDAEEVCVRALVASAHLPARRP